MRHRPLFRLLLMTFLPVLVLTRARKPWRLFLTMLLGWYVRFTHKMRVLGVSSSTSSASLRLSTTWSGESGRPSDWGGFTRATSEKSGSSTRGILPCNTACRPTFPILSCTPCPCSGNEKSSEQRTGSCSACLFQAYWDMTSGLTQARFGVSRCLPQMRGAWPISGYSLNS